MNKRELLIKQVDDYCYSRDENCVDCVFNGDIKFCFYHDLDDEQLEEAISLIRKNANKDNVNHPSHYNREGAMECIDEMELLFGIEETMAFCKLNAWKYRSRAFDKGGTEDLQKSDWYIKKYAELNCKLNYTEEREVQINGFK